MRDVSHALISLETRYADGILGGAKRVELRRRPMKVSAGATLWLYAKVPTGEVVGRARIRALHHLAPSTLWKRFGDVSGLTRREFFDYFDGLPKGFALELEAPERLAAGIPLEAMRCLADRFQPPQFFQHLSHEGPLVSAFMSVLSSIHEPTTSSAGD